jgi:hypothetical protein
MNLKEARIYLRRATRRGYVPYHGGICRMITGRTRYGKEVGHYGINIDGDGHDGRLFGCPKLIWDADTAEDMFPA